MTCWGRKGNKRDSQLVHFFCLLKNGMDAFVPIHADFPCLFQENWSLDSFYEVSFT